MSQNSTLITTQIHSPKSQTIQRQQPVPKILHIGRRKQIPSLHTIEYQETTRFIASDSTILMPELKTTPKINNPLDHKAIHYIMALQTSKEGEIITKHTTNDHQQPQTAHIKTKYSPTMSRTRPEQMQNNTASVGSPANPGRHKTNPQKFNVTRTAIQETTLKQIKQQIFRPMAAAIGLHKTT